MQAKNNGLPEGFSGNETDRKQVEKMMKNLNASQTARVEEILSDREKLRTLLESPAAKKLINELKGKE